MDKNFLRRVLEDELVNKDIDPDDAAEIADSVVERCDEEGFFDSDTEGLASWDSIEKDEEF